MRKSCADLPAGCSAGSFPDADDGSFLPLPDISNFSDSMLDAELFEGLELDGSLQLPALDSGHPNTITDCPPKEQAAGRGSRKRKSDGGGIKVAFKTMSEVEIMDDGYRWRKYGKKMVKDNRHPRNYYRCSHGGCGVKKRVERDREDPRFVVTTYEGMHNHECSRIVYYITPQYVCDDGGINAAQASIVSQGAPHMAA